LLSNLFNSPDIVFAVVKVASKCLILLLVYNACDLKRKEILNILDGHNNYYKALVIGGAVIVRLHVFYNFTDILCTSSRYVTL